MFSPKIITKSVIRINDEYISYLTVSKNEHGFFIDNYESIEIPEGIIVKGEILKADILYTLLKKIKSQIKNNHVDILLPHDYFLCSDAFLGKETEHKDIKKRIKEYFKNKTNTEPWHTTHVCEFSTHEVRGKEKVLFKCLPKDIQKSYVHVCKKSGFKINSISSDILAFDHFFKNERTLLVHVEEEHIRVAEFKSGMYVSHKTFQASYKQFTQEIMNQVKVPYSKARSIIGEYGFLRDHKEEKVYTRLVRSLSPLIDFISKSQNEFLKIKGSSTKTKESVVVKVVFGDIHIPGFVDMISQSTRGDISEFDIVYNGTYTFQDVLTLHRKDSYQYQSHIAQALKNWLQ
jgi:Tfp pilus assembly PilM family ATPase